MLNSQSHGRKYQAPGSSDHRRRWVAVKALVLLLVFALGGGGGYMMGRQSMQWRLATR